MTTLVLVLVLWVIFALGVATGYCWAQWREDE